MKMPAVLCLGLNLILNANVGNNYVQMYICAVERRVQVAICNKNVVSLGRWPFVAVPITSTCRILCQECRVF